MRSGKPVTTPLLLASSWEVDVAKDIPGLHLSVTLPIIDRLILHHTCIGYNGGLNLVEDIYSTLLAKHRD
nr:hypothetical protein [Sporomusa acidovorans]